MYSKGDICNLIKGNIGNCLGFFLTMEFHCCWCWIFFPTDKISVGILSALSLLFYTHISQQNRSVLHRQWSIVAGRCVAVTDHALHDSGCHNLNTALTIMTKPSTENWPSAPCRRGSDTLSLLELLYLCQEKKGSLPRLCDVQELAKVLFLSTVVFTRCVWKGS